MLQYDLFEECDQFQDDSADHMIPITALFLCAFPSDRFLCCFRVDLIVTETFDCGLFGEHILETLQHALKNLVREQSPVQVIPAGASVYVCAIECAALRHQHR